MAEPTRLEGKSEDFADKRAIPSSDESRAPVDPEASQNDFFAELDGPDDAITTHHAPPPSQASRSPTKISPTTLGDPESESPDLSDSSPFDDTAAVDLFGADAEEANDEPSDASQGPQDAMIEELGGVSSDRVSDDRVSDHGVSNESLSEDDEAALNAALKDLGRGALTQRPSPSRNRDTVGRVVVSDEASNNFDEQTPDSLDHLLADEADTELIEDASAQQATDPIDLLDSTPDETINSLDELGTDQANADLIEEASADPATDSIDLFDATQDETATDLVTDADDLLDPNTIDGASTALHLNDGEDAAESTAPPSRSEDEDDPLASLDHEETSMSKAYAVAANRALLALNLAGDDAQTAAVAAAPALAAAGLGPGVLITMATTGELTPLCLWRTSTGRPNVNAADLARYAPISLINAMAAFSASWSNGEKLSQAPGLAHLREWKKDAPDSKLLACVLPTASGSKLAVLVAAAPEFSANHSIQDAVSALLGALARAC